MDTNRRKITKIEEKKALKIYERMLKEPDLIMWVEAVVRNYEKALTQRNNPEPEVED